MSLWERIKKTISDTVDNPAKSVFRDASRYAFIDVEVGLKDHRIHDIGALRWDRAIFHATNKSELLLFLKDVDFVCGHNIIHHDAKYLFGDIAHQWMFVDMLYVSPLLFPEKPYHRLLKDDKLICDQINNPVNDCEKAYDLLMDEVARWSTLSQDKKSIYATLLDGIAEFEGFLQFVNANVSEADDLANLIRSTYQGKICEHADIENIIEKFVLLKQKAPHQCAFSSLYKPESAYIQKLKSVKFILHTQLLKIPSVTTRNSLNSFHMRLMKMKNRAKQMMTMMCL